MIGVDEICRTVCADQINHVLLLSYLIFVYFIMVNTVFLDPSVEFKKIMMFYLSKDITYKKIAWIFNPKINFYCGKSLHLTAIKQVKCLKCVLRV